MLSFLRYEELAHFQPSRGERAVICPCQLGTEGIGAAWGASLASFLSPFAPLPRVLILPLSFPYPFPEFPFFPLPSDYHRYFGLDAAGLDSRGTLAGFQRAYHSRSFLIEESFSLCGLQELGSPVAREGSVGGECLFWK